MPVFDRLWPISIRVRVSFMTGAVRLAILATAGLLAKGTVVRSNFHICYFFCSVLLVLIRSAQTAHVAYTSCDELVFW